MVVPLLDKCTDYRHVPPFLVLCGTEPKAQGVMHCTCTFYQLSYIPILPLIFETGSFSEPVMSSRNLAIYLLPCSSLELQALTAMLTHTWYQGPKSSGLHNTYFTKLSPLFLPIYLRIKL